MRKFILIFSICIFSIPFLLIISLVLAIETQPRVNRQVILTPEHIERAKKIIDTHRNQVNADKLSIAKILSKDVDIAANYLANRFTKGSAQIAVADRNAQVRLSLPLPENIIAGYLNFEATLVQTTGLPQPQSVSIGNLLLPDFVTNFLTLQLINWLQNDPDIRYGMDAIKLVQLSPDKINIMYHRWNGNLPGKEMSIPAISKKAQEQIYRYHMLLVKTSKRNNARTVTLSEILPPLMRVAAKHSLNGDALGENRAVILTTAFHVLGLSLKPLIPAAAHWPRPDPQLVTLEGRGDFAQHFIVSAAITAYADTILSDAIGLYKEIEDSRYGSGFSFNDIAANRAGTRFGERAVAGPSAAKKLQRIVAAGLSDTDLMPPWSDLPEHMPETEFKRRYGAIDSPVYHQMMQEIEKRVSTLRVLR